MRDIERPKKRSAAQPAGEAERGESWFRALADATSTAIFVYRQRFLYVNRATERLTGYSASELLEMPFVDLVHPEVREEFGAAEAERLRGPTDITAHRELKIVRKNGEHRWLDFTGGQIAFGSTTALVGTAFDITEHKTAELALAESQERLELAQRAARSVSWEWNLATDELTFAEYADELLGFAVRSLIHSAVDFLNFVHPDDRERLLRSVRRTLKGSGDLAVEIRVITPSGDMRWLAEKALPVRDESGWTTKVIGIAHDVTERKIAEEAFFQEKEKALITLASIADGVIRTDANGAIDYLNPVAQRHTGWSLAEAYSRPVGEVYRVIDHESGEELLNPVDRCLEERRNVVYPGDRHMVHRNGTEFAIHDSAAPIRDRRGEVIGAILVFKDLSELRQVEREMIHQASHDPLTGLINRREFELRLDDALASARAEGRDHVLCYIDLDQFKLINDTCGHAAGDQMLQQLATVIAKKVRAEDVLSRLGGDEFGILLHNCSAESARRLIEQLAATVNSYRFSWGDRIYSTGVSAGLVPIHAQSPARTSLLSDADAACYVAKESGGNRIHLYQPGDTAVAERHGEMQWISRIHKALDEERFSLYRQSIVPLATGTSNPPLSELFIRLRDESGKLIEPGAFIPAAEKFGLITSIDRWVISTALERLASEQRSGSHDSRFAINVSGQSLGEKNFLDFVIEQFEKTGVEAEAVYFEITETSAIAELQHAMSFIAALKRRGCRFVLDDFGKGLSSFAYLKNLAVDFLKIDGGFVRNLTTDPIQAAMVASIHDIGHTMGLRTIAEEVEDQETVEALRKIGVDYVQGFFLSQPEPLFELAEGPAPARL